MIGSTDLPGAKSHHRSFGQHASSHETLSAGSIDCSTELDDVGAVLTRLRTEMLEMLERQRPARPTQFGDPGPNESEFGHLLSAAAAACEHGPDLPWRMILIPQDKRGLVSEALAIALCELNPEVDPLKVSMVRQEVFRPPLLLLAVVKLSTRRSDMSPLRRAVSLGCAIQNMLSAASAMNFKTGLTLSKFMESTAVRELFRLSPEERAVCFVNIGTVRSDKAARWRPKPEQFLSQL